jgi:hypothetical protein
MKYGIAVLRQSGDSLSIFFLAWFLSSTRTVIVAIPPQ